MARHPSPASVAVGLLGAALAAYGVAATVGAGTARASGTRYTPVVAAVRRAAPAVVNITTDLPTIGRGYAQTRASGSGVIVHPGGYVVTNSHVVRDASRIVCETSKASGGGKKAYEARLLEDDPSHDLALLRIGSQSPFPYVPLCPTCDVMVGETAIAIGNPFGLGDTVTVGIVSAMNRTAALNNGHTLSGLLQTDASINLGNSGGALLDLDGELIGINSSMHPNAQGIAFTVPADAVQALLDRNLGAAARPPPPPLVPETPVAIVAPTLIAPPSALPVPRQTLAAPTPRVRAAARAPVGLVLRSSPAGVVVASVEGMSNADIAGLLAGDVILEVDGKPATDAFTLKSSIDAAVGGRTFVLTVLRGGRRQPVILLIPS